MPVSRTCVASGWTGFPAVDMLHWRGTSLQGYPKISLPD